MFIRKLLVTFFKIYQVQYEIAFNEIYWLIHLKNTKKLYFKSLLALLTSNKPKELWNEILFVWVSL